MGDVIIIIDQGGNCKDTVLISQYAADDSFSSESDGEIGVAGNGSVE
jgi:hypothetical protein